ncbi:hypothetical protein D3C81_2009510 [compost metagenome]
MAGGGEDQAVTELVVGAEHHEQAGALVRDLDELVGDAVAHRLAGLVDGQHVAFHQAVALALVDGHHIELADLGHTTRYVEDHAIDVAVRRAGHERGVDRAFLGWEQAVAQAHFLGGTGQ